MGFGLSKKVRVLSRAPLGTFDPHRAQRNVDLLQDAKALLTAAEAAVAAEATKAEAESGENATEEAVSEAKGGDVGVGVGRVDFVF